MADTEVPIPTPEAMRYADAASLAGSLRNMKVALAEMRDKTLAHSANVGDATAERVARTWFGLAMAFVEEAARRVEENDASLNSLASVTSAASRLIVTLATDPSASTVSERVGLAARDLNQAVAASIGVLSAYATEVHEVDAATALDLMEANRASEPEAEDLDTSAATHAMPRTVQ